MEIRWIAEPCGLCGAAEGAACPEHCLNDVRRFQPLERHGALVPTRPYSPALAALRRLPSDPRR